MPLHNLYERLRYAQSGTLEPAEQLAVMYEITGQHMQLQAEFEGSLPGNAPYLARSSAKISIRLFKVGFRL